VGGAYGGDNRAEGGLNVRCILNSTSKKVMKAITARGRRLLKIGLRHATSPGEKGGVTKADFY